jgi:ATP-binding cassette, subfamily B, bacterial MsbA
MAAAHRKLLKRVGRHAPMLITALLLAALLGALESASAILVGPVFDAFLGTSRTPPITIPLLATQLDFSQLGATLLLTLLVISTIAKSAAEYGTIGATACLGQSVVRDLRNDVFDNILRQPLEFFHGNPTGELISRVSTDVERVQTAASETLAEFFKQAAILAFLTATLFVVDWRLSLATLVLAPAVFYPTVWFGRRLRRLSRSNQQDMAEMSNVLFEAFSGNRIVKAFRMEEVESGRFQAVTSRLFHVNLRQKMTHALSSPLMETLGILVVAAFLLYARSQVTAQRMTAGLVVVFVVALVKLYDGLRRMSGISNSFQQALGASSRIFELLELRRESDDGRLQLDGFKKSIEFRNVSFEYSPRAPAIQDVSLHVGRGEVVAIAGASGAGKTTMVNLVPRFFDVTNGSILIDGNDIRNCTLESLRKQIAIVTQDVILFDDTIRANIAYGDPAATEEQIQRAAHAALADDFVSVLPEKYDTRIGERGLRLSGGERQRISIARALLKNAPILILDEATSSLDAESEVYVQRALQNLMEGRTTIVIAHRLSTIRRADRIVVLGNGRVLETGSHEELIARKGAYWKLYNLQFADTSAAVG